MGIPPRLARVFGSRALLFAVLRMADAGTPQLEVFQIPPGTPRQPRYVIPLDRRLVISDGAEVRFLGPGAAGGAPSFSAKGSLCPLRHGVAVVSEDVLLVLDEDGGVRKRIRLPNARPCVSQDGHLLALVVTGKEGQRIVFLSESLEVQAEQPIPVHTMPVVLGTEKHRYVLVSSHQEMPFRPQDTFQLWEGSRLVADLKRQYAEARSLGVSRAGRIYLAAGGDKDMRVVALGPQAEKLWDRHIPGGQKSILFVIGADREAMGEAVLLGYEDPGLKKGEGLLRQVLIDGGGRTIRDVSELSYGSPQAGADGNCIVLTSRTAMCCLEMHTGRTLWSKATASLLGTDPRRSILGYAMTDTGPTSVLVYLLRTSDKTAQSAGEAKLLAVDIRTGSPAFEKTLGGVDWRIYASPRGTVWALSAAEGRGYRLGLGKS